MTAKDIREELAGIVVYCTTSQQHLTSMEDSLKEESGDSESENILRHNPPGEGSGEGPRHMEGLCHPVGPLDLC